MIPGGLLRQLVQAWRDAAAHYTRPFDRPALGPSGGRLGGKSGRPNPWVKCPTCYRRNPVLCDTAEEGAEPCGNGMRCGCCTGPHRAKKTPEDGGKFQTTVQKVKEG